MTDHQNVPSPVASPPQRELALDAYRGFVMLAMASGGASIFGAVVNSPENSLQALGAALVDQFEHADWHGATFWDMIQPSFMFLVGAAMPYSYARRRALGQGTGQMLGHVLVRSAVLVLLAVFLSSQGSPRTNFVFTNVLAQIGLGYPFVFLSLGLKPRAQLGVGLAILVGYWLLFLLYPYPYGPPATSRLIFELDGARVPAYFLHWSRDMNPAIAFDRWFLNLFPRPNGVPFLLSEGGYTTLNFIPSIATMISGVLAGELLRSPRTTAEKFRILLVAGALCWALSRGLDAYACPIVKRIWSPSWVVFSTGQACWWLAAFLGLSALPGAARWLFPLTVVGMNSIAIYMMAQLMKPFVRRSLAIHLGSRAFSGPWGPLVAAMGVLLVFWLICFWLYRRKIFIRI